jgi:hypothetical protein
MDHDNRPGSFGYAAGVIAATVDVPARGDIQEISVVAGAAAATITIGGGAVITVPAGMAFTAYPKGEARAADVVIGGTPASYYVAWNIT